MVEIGTDAVQHKQPSHASYVEACLLCELFLRSVGDGRFKRSDAASGKKKRIVKNKHVKHKRQEVEPWKMKSISWNDDVARIANKERRNSLHDIFQKKKSFGAGEDKE